MKKRFRDYFINLLIPSFVFGSVTGIATAVVICLYKLCASYVIDLSTAGYGLLRKSPVWLALIIPALFLVAWIFSRVYRKRPNLSGGGIPTSIGILRGILPIRCLENLFGVFALSLTTFLIGVPLGNEGPSVQMGVAVGKGCVRPFSKKHTAWERYSMTGGACAGFSVATGAPISGILFAIEEAHQRISPMLLTVSATSVMFAALTSELLTSFLPIHASLFDTLEVISLGLADIWIPLLIGVAVGLFAVLFLKYYRVISKLARRIRKKISNMYLIFAVFVLSVVLGVFSNNFVSTGHHLMLFLFVENLPIGVLLLVLIARATVTLMASSANITGGLFVPILTLGAISASIIGSVMTSFGLGADYGTVVLALGITACIAAMLKMPLTAIVFAVEAFSCYENVLYVIVVAVVSYVITELFGVKSITDSVIEHRVDGLHRGESAESAEVFVTVGKGSFAVGKQIRDVLWPHNTFILSVKFSSNAHVEVDEHGGMVLREGDVLHLRYHTYDAAETQAEILAIVGDQPLQKIEIDTP